MKVDPCTMSISLPTTKPGDDRAGVGVLFAGLAIPYMLGVLLICAGLVVGGTIGFALAYGSLLALLAAVVTGILRFIRTDDE